MDSYQPSYEYVLDSSALFDLKRLYPIKIFPGVWEKFNELCANKSIIAPREVLNEIRKGDDELLKWVDEYEEIFLEPTEQEYIITQEVLEKYPPEIIIKYSVGRPWADPFVISCAKHYGLIVIQHEVSDSNQYKIPAVAKKFNVTCKRLVDLFDREGWLFVSS